MTLQVGERAPDFTLPDQHRAPLGLHDLAGGRVAVVFYPFAFSGVCTGELRELRDSLEMLEENHVRVVAVSCDPVPALRAWSEAEGFGFPLLSDFWPHGAVARAYGVFDAASGFALRGTFLLDEGGVLRWSVVQGPGEARPLAALTAAVTALPVRRPPV